MELLEQDFCTDEIHPIDIVESLAGYRDWDFDRVDENQIAMAVEGAWSTYSVSLAWSAHDETLRLFCTFDLDAPEERRAEIALLTDMANDMLWTGGFSHWRDQKMIAWRYGLLLSGGGAASPAQIDAMLAAALMGVERFYPAYQLTAFGGEPAEAALGAAIADAIGQA